MCIIRSVKIKYMYEIYVGYVDNDFFFPHELISIHNVALFGFFYWRKIIN